jgi:hypothetical protein
LLLAGRLSTSRFRFLRRAPAQKIISASGNEKQFDLMREAQVVNQIARMALPALGPQSGNQ